MICLITGVQTLKVNYIYFHFMYLISHSSRRMIGLIGLAVLFSAAVVALSSTIVNAASSLTATVTATVTVQNITLTVSTGTVAWGTLPAGTASSTNSAYTQTVTNGGNVAENFLVQGQDSTNWTIGATPGSDVYSQSFCNTGCTSAPTGYTALTATTNQSLATNIAAGGTTPLDLYLQTPSSSTVYTQQSVDVTLTAAAN